MNVEYTTSKEMCGREQSGIMMDIPECRYEHLFFFLSLSHSLTHSLPKTVIGIN
jgi:hypothetical protein